MGQAHVTQTLANAIRHQRVAHAILFSGPRGTGKTTVANEILRRVGRRHIAHLNQDRYYRDLDHLTEDERIRHNFDHPSAIEEPLLIAHLEALKANMSGLPKRRNSFAVVSSGLCLTERVVRACTGECGLLVP